MKVATLYPSYKELYKNDPVFARKIPVEEHRHCYQRKRGWRF